LVFCDIISQTFKIPIAAQSTTLKQAFSQNLYHKLAFMEVVFLVVTAAGLSSLLALSYSSHFLLSFYHSEFSFYASCSSH